MKAKQFELLLVISKLIFARLCIEEREYKTQGREGDYPCRAFVGMLGEAIIQAEIEATDTA